MIVAFHVFIQTPVESKPSSSKEEVVVEEEDIPEEEEQLPPQSQFIFYFKMYFFKLIYDDWHIGTSFIATPSGTSNLAIIRRIPPQMHSKNLRRFFAGKCREYCVALFVLLYLLSDDIVEYIEEKKFLCFHFRHRPEAKAEDDSQVQSMLCRNGASLLSHSLDFTSDNRFYDSFH